MLKCCITTSSRVLGFTKPTMQLLSCTDRRFGQDSFMPSKVTQFLPKVFCILKCMGKFFLFWNLSLSTSLGSMQWRRFCHSFWKNTRWQVIVTRRKQTCQLCPSTACLGWEIFKHLQKWCGTRILLSIGRISLLYRTISVFLKFARKYSKNPKWYGTQILPRFGNFWASVEFHYHNVSFCLFRGQN